MNRYSAKQRRGARHKGRRRWRTLPAWRIGSRAIVSPVASRKADRETGQRIFRVSGGAELPGSAAHAPGDRAGSSRPDRRGDRTTLTRARDPV